MIFGLWQESWRTWEEPTSCEPAALTTMTTFIFRANNAVLFKWWDRPGDSFQQTRSCDAWAFVYLEVGSVGDSPSRLFVQVTPTGLNGNRSECSNSRALRNVMWLSCRDKFTSCKSLVWNWSNVWTSARRIHCLCVHGSSFLQSGAMMMMMMSGLTWLWFKNSKAAEPDEWSV